LRTFLACIWMQVRSAMIPMNTIFSVSWLVSWLRYLLIQKISEVVIQKILLRFYRTQRLPVMNNDHILIIWLMLVLIITIKAKNG
jgi:hypothetical protein